MNMTALNHTTVMLSEAVEALLGAALAGCESEGKKMDDSKPAPEPTYHMVPSQSDPNYKK
jgi:hypothetical protein